MPTHALNCSSFGEPRATSFCAGFRRASPISEASAPEIAGCRRGNSWCLKHSRLRPKVSQKHEIGCREHKRNRQRNLLSSGQPRETPPPSGVDYRILKHSFLRNKLVLKGGTALNLFYLDLARLSVDIDLNYIGREEMLSERPDVTKAGCRHQPRSGSG
ncbi:MAG TPA: nucleotidyl transferase AbiEii/AbiGii toxin family protein [Candidatus Dormibacteraeota bacterium]|nr:nucleotidyl transferase AbiEii/AbiGii toxin family protein [Candidatus Dormibacteraeota bacterium]